MRRTRARVLGASLALMAAVPVVLPGIAAGRRTTNDSWPMYHRDPQHRGAVNRGPSPSRMRRVWVTAQLDQDIYAEPLLVRGMVIVATEGNTVAAFDAASGKQRWIQQLGTPVNGSDLPCGNINPSGITSTPVVDSQNGTVDVVTFTRPAHHLLVALDVSTGTVRFQRDADPPGADPTVQQQRGALGLVDGHVLVPYGGLFGDCGAYHGYVVGVPANGTGDLRVFQVPAARAAAVWTPSGVSIDPDGNVLVATGNATRLTPGPDLSNSVIRLSPQLQVIDSWSPTNRDQLSLQDIDLGQIAPVVVPGGYVLEVGKDGIGYLLRNRALGGTGGQVYEQPVCDRGAWGGTATRGTRVYVACGEGLAAVDVAKDRFQVTWRSSQFDAGPPILTGTTVWSLHISGGTLLAFDGKAGTPVRSVQVGDLAHFATPTAGGGRLYVAAGRRLLAFK